MESQAKNRATLQVNSKSQETARLANQLQVLDVFIYFNCSSLLTLLARRSSFGRNGMRQKLIW